MKILFPDISQNGVGQDGTPIVGGSIGSNVILYNMRNTASLIQSPRWDLYLINVYTLVRNLYQKGINQKDIEIALDHEADLYMTYIHAYTCFRQTTQSTVFFYAPNYDVVPTSMMREHTGNVAELNTLYKKIYNKLPDTLKELTEVRETRKFLCRVGNTIFPHKDIVEKLKTIYSGHRYYGSIGTVMISHCPIDLHIYKSLPSIQLLDSYTGTVFNVSDFGQKLTKEVKVPFNTTTHRLFGDGLQLIPLVKGRDRKILVELAQTKNWAIKTESEIQRDALYKFNNIFSSDLSVLRF